VPEPASGEAPDERDDLMRARCFRGRQAFVNRLTVVLAVLCGGVWHVGSSAAADHPVVNCNQVEQWDRCDCNRRVLRALNDTKAATEDPTQSRNTTPRNIQDAVQEEQRHRLQTFIAKPCDRPASPSNLPDFNERSTRFRAEKALATNLRPLLARDICIAGCDVSDVPANRLLPGRWEGWQTLADGKAVPLFLHITADVRATEGDREGVVQVCSSNGMVFGVLHDGFLELPGPRIAGLTYAFRLWRGGPHHRDLEGVVLLDLRPKDEVVAGLVWLTRAPKFAWSLMPTAYFCEDREFEDRRQVKPFP
jgi:hypothetical protein